MISLKDFNLKHLGDILILGFVTMLIVALFHVILSPVLAAVLPTVFATPLSITDTLLLVLLVTMIGKK